MSERCWTTRDRQYYDFNWHFFFLGSDDAGSFLVLFFRTLYLWSFVCTFRCLWFCSCMNHFHALHVCLCYVFVFLRCVPNVLYFKRMWRCIVLVFWNELNIMMAERKSCFFVFFKCLCALEHELSSLSVGNLLTFGPVVTCTWDELNRFQWSKLKGHSDLVEALV